MNRKHRRKKKGRKLNRVKHMEVTIGLLQADVTQENWDDKLQAQKVSFEGLKRNNPYADLALHPYRIMQDFKKLILS